MLVTTNQTMNIQPYGLNKTNVSYLTIQFGNLMRNLWCILNCNLFSSMHHCQLLIQWQESHCTGHHIPSIYIFHSLFCFTFRLLLFFCLEIVTSSFFNLFWSLSSFSTYPWAITVAHPDDCSAGDLLAADQFCLISKSCPLMSLMRQTENPITLNARMFPK